jgi:hypothetical protein
VGAASFVTSVLVVHFEYQVSIFRVAFIGRLYLAMAILVEGIVWRFQISS